MRRLPTLALAFLVVTAGCAGLGGSDAGPEARTVAPQLEGTPTPTLSPTPTPTPSSPDVPLPSGVTPGAADEVDERALLVAHVGALANRSVTVREQQVLTGANGTVLGWYTVTAWTDGARQRYALENGGAAPDAVDLVEWETVYWTDGNVTVSRQTLANGSTRTTVADGGPSSVYGDARNARSGRYAVEATLAGADLRYVGVGVRDGTPVHLLSGTTDDARLTLRVSSDGVIRSYVRRTDTEVNGTRASVLTRFRAFDVGDTTVEKPAWAANATG